MKQKIERTNTSTKRFSVRTIAMVLSIVMLIGSIATGSMLSTFAAYLKDAAKSDALSQAATEGGDIALNAIPSEDAAVDNADEKPDLSGFEENEIVRGMKDDLAASGAKANLSGTGSKNWGDTLKDKDCKVHGNFRQDGSYNSTWEYTWMYVSNWNEASVTYLCKANTNYYFRINVDGTEFSPTSDNDTKITTVYDSPDKDANGAFYITTNNASSGFVKVVIRLWADYNGNNRIEVTQTSCSNTPNAFGQPQGQSSWSTSNITNLSYDDATGRYYFDADNKGWITFRFWLFDTHHFSPQRASGDNVSISSDSSNRTPCWEVNSSGQNVAFTADSTNRKIRIWISAHGVDTTWTNAGGVTIWYEVLEDYASADTYTVVGGYGGDATGDEFAYYLTKCWKADQASNNMTYNSTTGCYEITYTSNIPDGTVSYKVVKDNDWAESWPSSNGTFKTYANATYVKFSFNPSDNKITVTSDGTAGGGGSGPSDSDLTDTVGAYFHYLKDGDNRANVTDHLPLYKTSADSNIYRSKSTAYITGVSVYFAGWLSGDSVSTDSAWSLSNYGVNGDGLTGIQYNSNFYNKPGVHVSVDGTDVQCYVQYNASNQNLQFYAVSTTTPDETKTFNIYAKDAALRENTFNRFARVADTVFDQTYFEYSEELNDAVVTYSGAAGITAYNANHSTKQISWETNHSSDYGTDAGYQIMKNVPLGAKIKIKTTLSSSASATGSFDGKAFKETHYLKAYSYNGVSYQINDYASSGEYEEIWTVRDINTKKMKGKNTIEVTPIYYMEDATNCKTFVIDGYDGEVQDQWGTMLSVYPYYENISGKDNAFGGYPGQPMLYTGGKYEMQIPLTVDGTASGASVKGLTLHNSYWDLLHRTLDNQCNSKGHAQTYDFDDFYKLNIEKKPDTIVFDFKYRDTMDNYGDGYDYTNYTFADGTTKSAADYSASAATPGNGVEILTDYYGRQVDVFGGIIGDGNQSTFEEGTTAQSKELLLVSTGYKDTYVGEYATLWAVYAPQSSIPSGSDDTAGKFIGYISSSMLYLSSFSRVNQYTGGTSTANGRMSWTEFEETYNHLKSYYSGVPALITYEKEIWNDSKDKANRSDGKWYYSKKSDKISANIKIQYGPASNINASTNNNLDNAAAWTDDVFSETLTGVEGQKNIGSVTKCSAYFTNTSPYLKGKVASGEQFADSSKKFTFQATESGAYMFIGWVRYYNGKYFAVSDTDVGSSAMLSNDVYIARFVQAQVGTLNISHVVESNANYSGKGTPSLTVVVKSGNTEKFSKTVSDGSAIDISDYINTKFKDYTIDISLSTDPDDDSDSFMREIVSSSGNFEASPKVFNEGVTTPDATAKETKSATVTQFTVGDILNSGITSLRYVSHLAVPTYTYNYTVNYKYTSRFWGEQSYTVSGTLISSDSQQMTNITGSKTSAKLTTDFLYNHTPYEKNFRQKIAWNHAGATQTVTGSGTTYTITATVGSTNPVDDRVTAEFMLPYKYDTKASGYSAVAIDKYASAESTTASGTEIVFDDKSYESAPITTQAYKLFTYDGSSTIGGSDSHASYMPLVEAAPYVFKDVTVHRSKEDKRRFLSAGVITEDDKNFYYFTYNSIRYFYKELPTDHLSSDVALTESNTCTFNGNTYTYALNLSGGCTYPDNDDNNINRPAVYYWDLSAGDKGQYCVMHDHYFDDGVIENTGIKKYFTRWDIYTSAGNYVASTYYKKFNYTGYENYTVIPIYESNSETVAQDSDENANSVPTINFLGDTRNQWNNDGGGNYNATQGDKLMTDFAISFDYYEDEIDLIKNRSQDSVNGKDIRIGMLIEQMDELDSAGGKKITDPSYYADKYKSSYTADTISSIETALSTNSKPTGTGANKVVNSKIAANVDGWGRLFTDTNGNIGNGNTRLAPIDNYNRLQWYYTFNNISTSTGKDTTDKNYVYRASAYLIETTASGTKVTLSTTPVYFTLYDLANRQLGELD